MKIAVLGAGTWAFALASLLGSKNYDVHMWTRDPQEAQELQHSREHKRLPGYPLPASVSVGTDLAQILEGADLVMEAVTSSGIRPVLSMVRENGVPDCPFVITSKGIEQNTGFLLTELAVDVLGQEHKTKVGCLSGPSHAEEVVKGLPTSVTGAAYDQATREKICEIFNAPTFRVYPNADIAGVSFGGAMKNIIAIACGISDGLGYGDNTKATLMTRGLHEIRKLAVVKGCDPDTLNGLAGMGDLCVTCLSVHSRNYRFGRLIAEGLSPEQAKEKIGMVVEGAYSCLSALQLGEQHKIALPITQTVHRILYEGLTPKEAVSALMKRPIKEEHL